MEILESHHGYFLWKYVPSIAGSGIFALLFAAAILSHCSRIYLTKSRFCVAFAIGCFFEFVDYCARASARNSTGSLMPYIIQNVFILVVPALFAASIYMTLGRTIRVVKGERHSLIRVTILTKIFVTGDVLSFLVQGGSAGLMIQSGMAKIGQAMVITELAMQIIMFGLFTVTAMIFHARLRRSPTSEAFNPDVPWKRTLIMLYAVSALIMIRSIFRMVEYLMGTDGYPLTHEWTLYCFDSVLMFLVTVIFYLRYPSDLQRTGDSENLQMLPQTSVRK